MPYKEKEIVKKYYKIHEVAEIVSLSTSAIRFYQKTFNLKYRLANPRGDRRFTLKDIEEMKYIKHLLYTEGYTIKGVMKKLGL